MQRFIFLSILLGILAPSAHAKPNVLVIYADDQGSLDLGCYGSEDLHTPHLDALAKRGVRFTQMYSPSAICSASRAGLLTGRIPARAGVPGNVSSYKGKPGMPASEVTLAEMLGEQGYETGHIGKWHLGYTPETMPNGQGFEYSFGHMGGCIDNYSHFFYWNGPNRHDLWQNGEEIWRDGQFFGDLMVDEVKRFVSKEREQPFFLYWAINFPHYPMQGTAKWREVYRNLPSPRRQYCEFVSTMDEMIGEVFGQLSDQGIDDDTLIIFQSDHGHSTEERAFFGGGNAGPYRGAKGCLFEGGIRIPSIVSWPGTLPENETRDQMVMGCDWYPTVAELCETKLPETKIDGKSIAKVIKSPEVDSPHEHLYWQLGKGPKAQWVVRQGDWKLLGNPQDRSNTAKLDPKEDKRYLVNLANDLGETTNVAAANPTVIEQLQKIRDNYAEDLQ